MAFEIAALDDLAIRLQNEGRPVAARLINETLAEIERQSGKDVGDNVGRAPFDIGRVVLMKGQATSGKSVPAFEDGEIDRILAMSGDELRAEIIAEGGDPDQVASAAEDAFHDAMRTAEYILQLKAAIARLKIDASNHAADAATVRAERDRAEAECSRLRDHMGGVQRI